MCKCGHIMCDVLVETNNISQAKTVKHTVDEMLYTQHVKPEYA